MVQDDRERLKQTDCCVAVKAESQQERQQPQSAIKKRFELFFQYCLYAHWKSAHNRSIVSVIIDRQQPCNSAYSWTEKLLLRTKMTKDKISWPTIKMGLRETTDASNLPSGKLPPAEQTTTNISSYRRRISQLHRLHGEVVCWSISLNEMLTRLIRVCNLTLPTCSDAAAVLIHEAFCGQILCSGHIKQDKRFLSQYRCWLSRGSGG